MNIKAYMVIGMCLVALLMQWPSEARAQDVLALEGVPLDASEMADIRGGFTTPDGNFLYFSMDFMKFNLMSHSAPSAGGENTGFLNALRQQAVIGKDGSIEFNLDIFQGGQTDSPTNGQASTELSDAMSGMPQQINSTLVNDSFKNFSGLNNANLISGNYNVGSIVNIINLRLGFFGNESVGTPEMANFLLY